MPDATKTHLESTGVRLSSRCVVHQRARRAQRSFLHAQGRATAGARQSIQAQKTHARPRCSKMARMKGNRLHQIDHIWPGGGLSAALFPSRCAHLWAEGQAEHSSANKTLAAAIRQKWLARREIGSARSIMGGLEEASAPRASPGHARTSGDRHLDGLKRRQSKLGRGGAVPESERALERPHPPLSS